MKQFFIAAAMLLCLVWSQNASAQTANATLGGTVSDTTGALIPGVEITATNVQTGIVSAVLTNEAGAYQFASLQTGRYSVRAELPGFQTQTRTDVGLGVSQQVRLNFTLQVGAVAEQVEVIVAADTLIATTSASVGAVLPEYKVRDLPLGTRNVLDLVSTTSGTQGSHFAGARLTQVNITRDGVPTGDARWTELGVFATTYVSPDLVEEVRVIVAPADAETGSGSGQVQMATRSGTNQFNGAVFWSNRNSALNANTWINNFNGDEKDYRNANQFGGRLGGPILRNKTFFFFLYEGQRFVTRHQFTGPVLTEEARNGNFRFFPGVQNGHVFSNNPVVDVLGNPVTPQGATGPLQTVSIFGRDSLRSGMDASGWVQNVLSRMPLPNDFTTGDGLNTAGFRWIRRVSGEETAFGDGPDSNRNQYNIRLDHNFDTMHKLTFSGSWEKNWAMSTEAGIPYWPGGPEGKTVRDPEFYSGSLVSTLSPSVVNEFRFGYRKNMNYSWSPLVREDEVGEQTRNLLPVRNGQIFFPSHSLFPRHFIDPGSFGATRGQDTSVLTFNDAVSWTQGTHAFKAGFETRLIMSKGFNGTNNPDLLMPSVSIGTGSIPVTGISTIPGIGANVNLAQNLLLDLSGSVGNFSQTYNIRRAGDPFIPLSRERDYRHNSWNVFFKDDWKIRPDLTLNLGVRYDYFAVPYEQLGALTNVVGGSAGLFGISGTSFADQWQPGRLNGSPTAVEYVGKNSPNPGTQLYSDDWNNFAPAVGLSWSLPWGGQDKTVLRAGYGINYAGSISFNNDLNLFISTMPGVAYSVNRTTLGLAADYHNLSNIPFPLPDVPAEIMPLDLTRLDWRSGTMNAYEDNRVTPYVQNWNLEIQRDLARNLTFEARYVGSKGTKLWGRIPLNNANIFENGILEAFEITRMGGDAPLFDDMLRGLNLGMGVINGTTVTGSASLRNNTLTRANLANGNVGALANFLNTSTTVTGRAGGLLLNSGLFPENFIVVNPQFSNVVLGGNPSNSTYHSMNLQLTKRLSQGFTNQTSYTWSRSIGDGDQDTSSGYIDPRNRSLNKSLLGFHRTHNIRSNGTFELPFGPNRALLNSGSGVLSRLVEMWQLGLVFSWTSGSPLNITAPISTITNSTGNMPVIVGDFPKSTGKIVTDDRGGTYFPGFQQVQDPGIGGVTTAQGLNTRFSNLAIADAQGNLVLVNPAAGQLGTLGQRWIEGPSRIGFDLNILKRVRIDENKQFEVRVDAVNVLNTPQWNNPTTNINSVNFGRTTAAGTTGIFQRQVFAPNRTITVNARLNF